MRAVEVRIGRGLYLRFIGYTEFGIESSFNVESGVFCSGLRFLEGDVVGGVLERVGVFFSFRERFGF